MPDITADLVAELVARHVPTLAGLPVTPVARQGWDNRTFRIQYTHCARLPSADGYSAGVEKEDHVLPLLAPHLPVAIPEVVASVPPSADFGRPWTVRRWLSGRTPDECPDLDRTQFAHDLGVALRALHEAPTDGGPWAGRHTYFRGCHPSVYADEVQRALSRELPVDAAQCRALWLTGLDSAWEGEPVWFHGDVAVGNVLVDRGRLSAVIDFGQCGVGDPACDLTIAWTYFRGTERQVFAEAVNLDADTWRRARAWALWKSLIQLESPGDALHSIHNDALLEILADPVVR